MAYKQKRTTKNSNNTFEFPEPTSDTITLHSLSSKLDAIIDRLDSIDSRFERSEQENLILQRKVNDLEERVESLEAMHRPDNIILSGSSLAELPSPNGNDFLNAIIDLLKRSMNYELNHSKVEAAYRLGSKPSLQAPDRRNILVKLKEDGLKRDVIAAFKSAKPTNLYVNEDLTPLKASMLYTMRRAKKRFPDKVVGSGSRDGRIYILFKTPDPNARPQRIFVRSEEQFEELCVKSLGLTPDEIKGKINQD